MSKTEAERSLDRWEKNGAFDDKQRPDLKVNFQKALKDYAKKQMDEIYNKPIITPMENLLNEMLEVCKKDRKQLARLKNVAIHCQKYELAGRLREIEKNRYPETKEERAAKQRANDLDLLFRMVDVGVPLEICWLIDEAIKLHNKKKGKFDIKDASKLVSRKNEIFFNKEV